MGPSEIAEERFFGLSGFSENASGVYHLNAFTFSKAWASACTMNRFCSNIFTPLYQPCEVICNRQPRRPKHRLSGMLEHLSLQSQEIAENVEVTNAAPYRSRRSYVGVMACIESNGSQGLM